MSDWVHAIVAYQEYKKAIQQQKEIKEALDLQILQNPTESDLVAVRTNLREAMSYLNEAAAKFDTFDYS